MLWVVRMTAVFPRLVDKRDITSHMNRLAIGSIPKILKHDTDAASQVIYQGKIQIYLSKHEKYFIANEKVPKHHINFFFIVLILQRWYRIT